MENNENLTLCAECGGHCCKGLPGCNFPQDFALNDTVAPSGILLNALRSEKYSIDWWDGEEDTYWVRPRTFEASWLGNDPSQRDFIPSTRLWHAGWPTGCTLLTPTGCSLPFDERPFGCKEVVPSPAFECGVENKEQEHPKLRAAAAWKPFLGILFVAAEITELDDLF